MAATRAKSVTLSGTTVSTVTFASYYPHVNVINRDATATHDIWVTTDGSTPTAGGDDVFYVAAGATVTLPVLGAVPQPGAGLAAGTTVKILGLSSNNNPVTVIGA